MILAGDIGGTKSYLGIFEQNSTENAPIREHEFSRKEYAKKGITTMVADFLAQVGIKKKKLNAACFGVAGNVLNGKCQLSNLDWELDERELSQSLNHIPVKLFNDMETIGLGIFMLSDTQLESLNPDVPFDENNTLPRAVIAAGTGLGEVGLFWNQKEQQFFPLASEGGHSDFAPIDKLQAKLFRYLLKQENLLEHVSYERVLSGAGLFNIYQFLVEKEACREEKYLKQRLAEENAKGENANHAAIISEEALAKKDDCCEKALDIFVSIYGARAGNLALNYKALGGIYLGGGIAPKIIEKLRDGTFMKAFKKKGRFKKFVSQVPVYVIHEPKVGLLGAAYYAWKMCEKPFIR